MPKESTMERRKMKRTEERNTLQATQELETELYNKRQQRMGQSLADSMLSSKRRASAPGGLGAPRSSRASTSLEDRISKNRSIANPRHRMAEARSRAAKISSQVKSETTSVAGGSFTAVAPTSITGSNAHRPSNVVPANPRKMQIKGTASGPFTVMATNFLFGTTAGDIIKCFKPYGESLLSCIVLNASPRVTVEVVYKDERDAENVIAIFNNSLGDDNILYVYMKSGPPSHFHRLRDLEVSPSPEPTPLPAREPTPMQPDEPFSAAVQEDDEMAIDDNVQDYSQEPRKEDKNSDRSNYNHSSRHQPDHYDSRRADRYDDRRRDHCDDRRDGSYNQHRPERRGSRDIDRPYIDTYNGGGRTRGSYQSTYNGRSQYDDRSYNRGFRRGWR